MFDRRRYICKIFPVNLSIGYSYMRHSQLRAFHHVALHGGFSRAAKALNQTQPSLSEQVKRLEQAHDVLLFHRTGRSLSLTETGAALLRLTRRYFETESEIGAFLSASRASVEGELRIIADSAHHLTRKLAAFRKAHPGVLVRLSTGNSESVLAALRNYEAEIGVIGQAETGPGIERVDLGSTPIVAMAPRGLVPKAERPLPLAALARWPLIFRENGSRTRAALERAARKAGIHLRPAMEVEGREAMREIVASGAGIGFVSLAEFGHDDRVEPIPLDIPGLAMQETLVYLAQRADMRMIRAFLRVSPD